jgi:valine dehydrogenase (NAD+)
VGARVVGLVLAEGGRALVHDVDDVALRRLVSAYPDVEVADGTDSLLEADSDVLVPCALGGVVTAEVAERLRVAAVCGGANNQLVDPALADRLAARRVLYAPDFLVNAGGVIAVAEEHAARGRYDDRRARARARGIGSTLLEVLRSAAADGVTPLVAAERLAEARIAAAPPRRPFGER